MGVTGGQAKERDAQEKLNHGRSAAAYRKSVFPDIQTSHESIAGAVRSIRSGAPDSDIFLAVDVYGYYGNLTRSLPGKLAMRAVQSTQYDDPFGADLPAFNAEYTRAFLAELTTLQQSLRAVLNHPGDELIFFFDNPAHVSPLKLDTYLSRRLVKQRAQAKFDSCYAAVQLIRNNPNLRNWEKRRNMRRYIWTIRKLAWSRSTVQIPDELFNGAGWPEFEASTSHRESLQLNFQDPAVNRATVADAYLQQNPWVQTAGSRIKVVKGQDEADMSIYRWCAAKAAAGNTHTLVLSGDSDFSFVPSSTDVNLVISFRRCKPNSLKLFKKPHILTSNIQLHSYIPAWPWQTDFQRIVAALFAGQDYVPGGAKHLGFQRLQRSGVCQHDTWQDTVSAVEAYLQEQGSPIWTAAYADILSKAGAFQLAIRACLLYMHPEPRLVSTILQTEVALQETPLAEAAITSHRERITLRFPARNQLPVNATPPPSDEARVASRRASSRPAREVNETLNNGRHAHLAHSSLHYTRVEQQRWDVMPAKREALLDPNIDVDIDPIDFPAQASRAALMRSESKTTAQAFTPVPPNVAAQAAPPAKRREEDGDVFDGPSRGKVVPGEIYPIVTAKRLLSSSLRSFTRTTQGRANPFFHYLKLIVTFSHCVNNILNRAMKLYVKELTENLSLLPHALLRLRGGKRSWQESVRMMCHLLGTETKTNLLDAIDTAETFLNEWAMVDQENPQGYRERLEQYTSSNGTFSGDSQVIRIISQRKLRPDQVDPALLKVASYLHQEYGRPPLGGVKVNWDIWTGQVQDIGASIARKIKSASLRQHLRDSVYNACRETSDGARWSESVAVTVFEALLQYTDQLNQSRETDWISALLYGIAACPAEARQSFTPLSRWLHRFANTWRARMPPSEDPSTTLDSLLTTQDPNIRISDMVPFFVDLGYDMTVDIAPRFVAFDFQLLHAVLRDSAFLPQQLMDWIRDRQMRPALSTALHTGLIDQARPIIGVLRELQACHMLDSTYRVREAWRGLLDGYCRKVLDALKGITTDKAGYRVPLINTLFDSCHLRSRHIWSGTFLTDGESVSIAILDIRKPVVIKPLQKVLDKLYPTREYADLSIIEVFKGVLHYAPTFASLETLSLPLGFAKRVRRCVVHPEDKHAAGRKPKAKDIERVFIRNTLEQLTGERPTIAAKPPQPAYPLTAEEMARKQERRDKKTARQQRREQQKMARQHRFAQQTRPGDGAVTILERIPLLETEDGIPREIKRLNRFTRTASLQELRILHERMGTPFAADCSVVDLLQHTIQVGVDPGLVFPVAMALQDEHCNRSARLMVSAKSLEHLRRMTGSAQSEITNSSPLDFDKLYEIRRSSTSARQVLDLDLLDFVQRELIRSTKAYGQTCFTSYRYRCRMEDLLADQIKRWIWRQEYDANPNLAASDITRPAIVYIGDGCEFDRSSRKTHTADFSTSLIRSVYNRLRARGFPVIFWRVSESYTSQCCPDPSCLRPRGRFWHNVEGARQAVHENNAVGKEQWIRSRMFYGTHSGTTKEALRLLQCEKCYKTLNRDVSASFCIEQAGAHILIHGQHPWRI